MPTTISGVPEFNGLSSYPEAIEHVLDNASSVGAVVIRNCFDASSADLSERQVGYDVIVPDDGISASASEILMKWWGNNGYAGTRAGSAYHRGFRYKSGTTLNRGLTRPLTVLTQHSCIAGMQEIYVLPSDSDCDPVTYAYSQTDADTSEEFRQELERQVTHVPTDSTRQRLFSFSARLEPGDLALVMGQPMAAYGNIKAARRSEYVNHSFPIYEMWKR